MFDKWHCGTFLDGQVDSIHIFAIYNKGPNSITKKAIQQNEETIKKQKKKFLKLRTFSEKKMTEEKRQVKLYAIPRTNGDCCSLLQRENKSSSSNPQSRCFEKKNSSLHPFQLLDL